ncbi:secreted RxLR effector protein 161-like [Vicia villosa]|uniref:secreted RxLR effector protein 161-like n=1 Tax=Vicia villosa TaxID=3911 RepID=UPI00273C839C|nr:secreted RxLR effector protein 161-like [Vicia villosa]
MAAINQWSLDQLDIKNAFLHGKLDKEVHMDQSPGFTIPGNSRLLCRLRRSLYGLKQSPCAWFGRFSSALIQFASSGLGGFVERPGKNRCLVGRLDYLTVTKPDITFAVSIVSQFLNALCDTHWNAVIQILRYIKNAPGRGLLYEDNVDAKITCYFDADWAGSPSDKRSTFGYCILIGENMISWKSKKQTQLHYLV